MRVASVSNKESGEFFLTKIERLMRETSIKKSWETKAKKKSYYHKQADCKSFLCADLGKLSLLQKKDLLFLLLYVDPLVRQKIFIVV